MKQQPTIKSTSSSAGARALAKKQRLEAQLIAAIDKGMLKERDRILAELQRLQEQLSQWANRRTKDLNRQLARDKRLARKSA